MLMHPLFNKRDSSKSFPRKLQAKLSAQSLGEARDSHVNLLRRSSSERRTEEHLLLGNVVVRHEPATAGEEDTFVNSRQEYLFFDSGVSLARGNAGVLAPVDFHPLLVEKLVLIAE